MLTPSKRIAGIRKRAVIASEAKAIEVVKAVGYIRVSTEEQVQNGLGLAAQETAIRTWVVSQGYELVDVIGDRGVSGASKPADRPGFGRVIDLAKDRAFSVLLVNKFDRLARHIVYSVTTVKDLDEAYGVAVRSLTEPIDTTTAMGRTIFAIFAGMAETEREVITDRMHGGRKEKANRGGFAGGEAPLGYRKDESGLVVDEDQAVVVRTIFALKRDGLTLQAIADRLNAEGVKTKKGGRWWPSTVQYMLDNRKYQGAVEYLFRRNGVEDHVLRRGKHKAIIA